MISSGWVETSFKLTGPPKDVIVRILGQDAVKKAERICQQYLGMQATFSDMPSPKSMNTKLKELKTAAGDVESLLTDANIMEAMRRCLMEKDHRLLYNGDPFGKKEIRRQLRFIRLILYALEELPSNASKRKPRDDIRCLVCWICCLYKDIKGSNPTFSNSGPKQTGDITDIIAALEEPLKIGRIPTSIIREVINSMKKD